MRTVLGGLHDQRTERIPSGASLVSLNLSDTFSCSYTQLNATLPTCWPS